MQIAEAVDVGAGIEQGAHDLDVAERRRPVKRGRVVSGLACVGIRARVEQQAHGIEMPLLGGLVQSRPSTVPVLGVRADARQAWIVRQEAAQGLDVAPGAGVDEIGIRHTPFFYAILAHGGSADPPLEEARYGQIYHAESFSASALRLPAPSRSTPLRPQGSRRYRRRRRLAVPNPTSS